MKKFVNETNDQKEDSIKIGSIVPNNAIGLSWFSANQISPANNITVVDLSETIPENIGTNSSNNRLTNDNEALLVYADELGFLRTLDGQYTFASDEITVSNLLLNEKTEAKEYDINSINPNDFVHFFYLSRFFISAPGDSFYLLSINDFVNSSNFNKLNLKVLDKDNHEYVDKNTGRKKYRFLLEPFITETNKLRNEIPFRVAVLLDATEPDSLKLVYDKVECDEFGNMFNVELNYNETINPIPLFKEVPEESFVIDDNSYGEKLFSIKKLNQRYFDMILNRQVDNGYQIVSGTKGINDYRVYENFNWRLIARTRRNVSFDQIEIEPDSVTNGMIVNTIRAGVLYSSAADQTSNSTIYPYIFARLSNSPFNLSKYSFINPLNTTGLDSTEIDQQSRIADYWKVDIDSISSLNEFDILAWSPTTSITSNQALKIRDFLLNNGTIVLDLTNCPETTGQALSNQLIKASARITSNYSEMDLLNPILDYTKNGGWTIGEDIFEKEEYGLFGSNYIFSNDTYKSYSYFESSVDSNNFLKVGTSSESVQSIGTLIPFVSESDALVRGNLVAVTFPLLAYCNSIYSISNPEQVVDSNFSNTYNSSQDENVYPGILEGPFKLLYNIAAFATYSKLQARRQIRTNSSLYNFVCPWRSSWVMDKNALLESELPHFTSVNVNTSLQVLAKDLDSTKNSIFEIYKSSLENFLPDHQKDLIFGINDPNEIDFFIEITNPDVDLTNAERVLSSSFNAGENIPSSYYLFKVDDGASKSFAYTLKPSPTLSPPNSVGAYAIIEKTYSSSNSDSLTNSLGNVLSSFKAYPFALSTHYSYLSVTDKPSIFDIEGVLTFDMLFKGSYTREVATSVDGGSTQELREVASSGSCIEIKSAIDDLNLLRETNSSQPSNTYLYTGDIDIHKDPRIWRNGSPTHEYVKYIQYTMANIGGYACKVDGIFGSQTEGAVRSFQTAKNQRYKDGTVDSETKSYMAFAWKALKSSNLTRYNDLRAKTVTDQNLNTITKYIDAAANAGTTSNINSKSYKKITFSGFSGPSQSFDILFFKVPTNFIKVNKIVIKADSNSIWQKFNIPHYGFSSTFKSDIFQTNVVSLNKSVTNGTIEIIFDTNAGVDASNVRYMWIAVNGGSLNNYGYAEGFGINEIKVHGTIQQSVTVDNPDDTTTELTTDEVYALATVKMPVSFSDISIVNPISRTYSTSNIVRSDCYVDSINVGYLVDGQIVGLIEGEMDPVFLDLDDETYYLDDNSDYLFNNDEFKFNFGTSPEQIEINNFSLEALFGDGIELDSNVTPNPVSISFNNTNSTSSTLLIEISSVFFGDSEYVSYSNDISTGYKLRTVDGYIYPDMRNSVSVNDGIILLCNSDGTPIGLPTSDDINTALNAGSSTLDPETDLRFGFLRLSNSTQSEDGFVYGFYDLVQKEFIGKVISYIDIISRGIQNIYPAVCAIDVDGNTLNRNEFIGPLVSTTFVPVNIPLKILAPIYSLKLKRSSSIRINPIDSNLSKFDAWELPISSGSFWKSINIRMNRNWTGWKSNYIGQSLRAYYTTLDQIPVSWSGIYGKGYYDVVAEQPILLDDRSISLRRIPIANFNYKTDYISSRFGILKPVIEIYIRESVDSTWTKVDERLIRDINCQTGLINFKTRIVPSNKNLIKVNYSTYDKSNLIRQINGNPIPLNPLLNSDTIDFDQPLYIYVLPKSIYKFTNDPSNLSISNMELVSEYSPTSVLGYTYESAMFDARSSKYDPFALLLGIIYVNNNPYKQKPRLIDVRVRGGGIKVDLPSSHLINDIPNVLSYWDVYPPAGEAYSKGGYVIIRIPEEVKDHFIEENEIYGIITNNLTAGIAYDLQDMSGNNWT